jgi:hypothetical protein
MAECRGEAITEVILGKVTIRAIMMESGQEWMQVSASLGSRVTSATKAASSAMAHVTEAARFPSKADAIQNTRTEYLP